MNVGQRMKELRLDKGLTQQDLADKLGIDRSNYSKYELGKLESNNAMLVSLSQIFGVSTDYLLGLEH